eukprot:CAMPEP_0119080416 /NCGR_PEP_ID=MMETSP1178-20130426/111870_1 /TAXON_ID=33656 /ORGANISM="unid sp, Strain CCMP2000" /LENGTH=286 /DNA_ID=CAMNT_0007063015 /DNA_START=29 /DNA_END=890 /DNA_ORIENTATION=+
MVHALSTLMVSLPLAGSWLAGTPLHVSSRHAVRRTASPRAMFSGIVEEMGSVARLEKRTDLPLWDGTVGEGWELEIEADQVLSTAELGCSIAVNGVCLTVTEFDSSKASFGLAPETLRLTNLADLKPGAPVNLERALAVDGRNSGHMVQGHIDDVGVIEEMRTEGDALWVRVKPPARLLPYIVPKGFIAIDGTSLTVCHVNNAEGWFDFMLVAYTQQHIVVPKKALGDKVNIEVDVTAKYVEKSMAALVGRVEELEREVASLNPSSDWVSVDAVTISTSLREGMSE